jgi:hypothetical protein
MAAGTGRTGWEWEWESVHPPHQQRQHSLLSASSSSSCTPIQNSLFSMILHPFPLTATQTTTIAAANKSVLLEPKINGTIVAAYICIYINIYVYIFPTKKGSSCVVGLGLI